MTDHGLVWALVASWLLATDHAVRHLLYPWLYRRSSSSALLKRTPRPLLLPVSAAIAGVGVAALFVSPAWSIVYGAAIGLCHVAAEAVAFAVRPRASPVAVDQAEWSPRFGVAAATDPVLSAAGVLMLARFISGPGRALAIWYPGEPLQRVIDAFEVHLSGAEVMRVGLAVGVAIALLIANIWLASDVVGKLLGPKSASVESLAPEESKSIPVTIGVLERLLIVLLALVGDTTAAGFVAAVKAFASSKRLDRQSASAQGMLIGTLASMLIAFTTALAARQILIIGGVLA